MAYLLSQSLYESYKLKYDHAYDSYKVNYDLAWLPQNKLEIYNELWPKHIIAIKWNMTLHDYNKNMYVLVWLPGFCMIVNPGNIQ